MNTILRDQCITCGLDDQVIEPCVQCGSSVCCFCKSTYTTTACVCRYCDPYPLHFRHALQSHYALIDGRTFLRDCDDLWRTMKASLRRTYSINMIERGIVLPHQFMFYQIELLSRESHERIVIKIAVHLPNILKYGAVKLQKQYTPTVMIYGYTGQGEYRRFTQPIRPSHVTTDALLSALTTVDGLNANLDSRSFQQL